MFPLIRRAFAITAVLGLLAGACSSAGGAAPATTEAPVVSTAVVSTPVPDPSPAPSVGDPDRVVQPGDAISVHYVGTLDDGEQFDSSRDGGQPLSFVVAAGQMIAGFDAAVRGMKLGEVKTVRIDAVDAYGERTEDRVITVAIGGVPEGTAVGDELSAPTGQRFVVLEVTETEVRLDGNHHLAGQALTFEIEIVSFDG